MSRIEWKSWNLESKEGYRCSRDLESWSEVCGTLGMGRSPVRWWLFFFLRPQSKPPTPNSCFILDNSLDLSSTKKFVLGRFRLCLPSFCSVPSAHLVLRAWMIPKLCHNKGLRIAVRVAGSEPWLWRWLTTWPEASYFNFSCLASSSEKWIHKWSLLHGVLGRPKWNNSGKHLEQCTAHSMYPITVSSYYYYCLLSECISQTFS